MRAALILFTNLALTSYIARKTCENLLSEVDVEIHYGKH